MSIILATWEAEIGTTVVQGYSRQKVNKIPSQPISEQAGMCLSSHGTWEVETGKMAIPGQPGHKSL
jgi:hypothetical protein